MILAFDTTSDLLSVTLASPTGKIVASRSEMAFQSHADKLTPTILTILGEAQKTKADLTAVLCALGPGSFTGIRIGVTTANSLGYGLGIPVAGVDTLSLWIEYGQGLGRGENKPRTIRAFLDAGRGEVYTRSLSHTGEYSEFQLLPLETLAEGLSANDLLIGALRQPKPEQIALLQSRFPGDLFVDMDTTVTLCQPLITLGLPRLAGKQPFSLLSQLEPLYLRETHITQSKKPRLLQPQSLT